MAKHIGPYPPRDGRDWDNYCARCGSSLGWVECDTCGGIGVIDNDCGADPEPNVPCDICRGKGGWWVCLSMRDWCDAHPLPGRKKIKRGEIEWYTLTDDEEDFLDSSTGTTGDERGMIG